MNINSGLNELYNESANLEITKSKIMLVISIIISSILFIVGVYLLFKKNNYNQTMGKVLSINSCNSLGPKQSSTCSLVVSYNINNNSYNNTVDLNLSPKVGDIVSIEYDILNPNNIRKPEIKPLYVGLILIAIAFFVVGVSYYNYYMSSKSKLYAATTGFANVSNLVKKIF